jgi:hypothetical protein
MSKTSFVVKDTGHSAHRRPELRAGRRDQIRSVADTTLVVWIEAVDGLISDRVAPRRFAYASTAVDSRTVGLHPIEGSTV